MGCSRIPLYHLAWEFEKLFIICFVQLKINELLLSRSEFCVIAVVVLIFTLFVKTDSSSRRSGQVCGDYWERKRSGIGKKEKRKGNTISKIERTNLCSPSVKYHPTQFVPLNRLFIKITKIFWSLEHTCQNSVQQHFQLCNCTLPPKRNTKNTLMEIFRMVFWGHFEIDLSNMKLFFRQTLRHENSLWLTNVTGNRSLSWIGQLLWSLARHKNKTHYWGQFNTETTSVVFYNCRVRT